MKRIIEQYQLNRIAYGRLKSFILAIYFVLIVFPKAEKQRKKFFEALDKYKGFNTAIEMVRAAQYGQMIISSEWIRKCEKILKVKYS